MGIVNLFIMFLGKNIMDGVVGTMEKNLDIEEED